MFLSFQEQFKKLVDDNPGITARLSKIQTLYDAWTNPPPLGSLDDTSYNDPNVVLEEEDGSSYDDPEDRDSDYNGRTNRTKSGRGDGFRPRTRSVAAERDHGNGGNVQITRLNSGPETRDTPATQKAPVAVKRQKVLSKATLDGLNQQFGEAVWTGDRIRHWSKTSLNLKKKKPVLRRHHHSSYLSS
jgi:hypothetical protein